MDHMRTWEWGCSLKDNWAGMNVIILFSQTLSVASDKNSNRIAFSQKWAVFVLLILWISCPGMDFKHGWIQVTKMMVSSELCFSVSLGSAFFAVNAIPWHILSKQRYAAHPQLWTKTLEVYQEQENIPWKTFKFLLSISAIISLVRRVGNPDWTGVAPRKKQVPHEF